jgi:hypothetical protein
MNCPRKPLSITTAKKLLYIVNVMNEAIKLRLPTTFEEAKLILSFFEAITSEAIIEAEDELGPAAAAA